MNSIPKQTRDNIEIVARHCGLAEANIKIMLEDAQDSPVKVGRVYASIVQSLKVKKK